MAELVTSASATAGSRPLLQRPRRAAAPRRRGAGPGRRRRAAARCSWRSRRGRTRPSWSAWRAAPGTAGRCSGAGFGARFDARQKQVHRETNRFWPRALGTTPWGAVRWLRDHVPAAGRHRVRLVDDTSAGDVADVLAAVGTVLGDRPAGPAAGRFAGAAALRARPRRGRGQVAGLRADRRAGQGGGARRGPEAPARAGARLRPPACRPRFRADGPARRRLARRARSDSRASS